MGRGVVRPGAVVVMDNHATHKFAGINAAIVRGAPCASEGPDLSARRPAQ
jgi:hypothetical protein